VYLPTAASAQTTVSYESGLLTIRCSDAPLSQVFEQIRASTGLQLILEDAVKSRRLTADIEKQPFALAIERLLEGSGVNYAMSFDLQDWQKVAKIFIGGGGENVARAAPVPTPARTPVRRSPRRTTTPAGEDPDEMVDEDYPEDFAEEEPDPMEDPGEFPEEEPPLEPDDPGFVPEPPSFPRSPFTPGLESSPFGTRQPQTRQPSGSPNTPPPAYYPFLDPLGRPIPVPPGTTPPEQQQEEQQQRRPPQSQ